MEVWEIMVPTVSNDGKPFRLRHHREWDKQVNRISNGMTILTPCKGQWIDLLTNSLYNERMIPVRIVCDRKQIIQIMKITQRHYNQIDVLAIKISSEALFLSNI